MPLTEVGGHPVFVQDLNPGAPEAVVMVHGLFTNHTVFYWCGAKQLARRYRVILYDLRGHGLTPTRADGDYTLTTMSDDLLALLDHLRIGRAHLVGYSFGGAIAVQAALRAPDRFARLALVEAFGLLAATWDLTLPGTMGSTRAGASLLAADVDAARLWRQRNSPAGTAPSVASPPAAADRLGAKLADFDARDLSFGPGSLDWRSEAARRRLTRSQERAWDLIQDDRLLNSLRRDEGFFETAPLEQIRQTTLLLYGRRSPYLLDGRLAARRIERARLRLARGDHNLPVRRSRWVRRRLIRFLTPRRRDAAVDARPVLGPAPAVSPALTGPESARTGDLAYPGGSARSWAVIA
jgi:pimeloyl-ACP methyl ester carboxylesterase